MTQEEKQLLLKDLCSRLPHGIRYKGDGGWGINLYQHTTSLCTILNSEEPLVYLRPMSSMTKEERRFLLKFGAIGMDENDKVFDVYPYGLKRTVPVIDYLISHHFDYRGLIPMGLALEAKEDMYKID